MVHVRTIRIYGLLVWACSSLLLSAAPAAGRDAILRQKLATTLLSGLPDEQSRALTDLSESGSKLVQEVLTAWLKDGVYFYEAPDGVKIPVTLEDRQDADGKSRALRIENEEVIKDAAGAELHFSSTDLTPADTDARSRALIQQALETLALSGPDPESRRSAVLKLANSGKEKNVAVLEARLAKENDSAVRKTIREGIAMLQLSSADPSVQITAVRELSRLNSMSSLDYLRRIAANPQTNPALLHATRAAVSSVQAHVSWVNFFGTVFRGVSLGSILLVVSLGLAITFGLMGIINMAHGEMIAIGAYTSYVVQNVFGTGFGFSITLPFHFRGEAVSLSLHLPGLHASGWAYETYFLFAIPLSFCAAAVAGMVLEQSVIRFLYRRPLESLLATWGVSLVMQQLFRMVFGANNVQVNSPSWLQGHFSLGDVSFGYNRVFVIVFAVLIVLATWLLLTKTPLGLLIRSVMENRNMAACLGVRTDRVNLLTFGFGSGLAGLAGAFLSQIGNVGPSLGQSYIVDSFMTVVVGGVGSIIGTICAALGIGTADQVLQQVTGSPVTGKIVVLVVIILFLQWKPGGLFAIRSRSLD